MKINQIKQALAALPIISFRLPDGSTVPRHFHITEVGLITKHFIDCGGVERREKSANFQLWEANDYDHRLAPQKVLEILDVSSRVLGNIDELEVEVEYQQMTIGKFGMEFDGIEFVLTNKHTACLAKDACGIVEPVAEVPSKACSPKSGCC